jgi:hypothetical protein
MAFYIYWEACDSEARPVEGFSSGACLMMHHLRIEVFLLTVNLVLFVMWCVMALWNALRKWLSHLKLP